MHSELTQHINFIKTLKQQILASRYKVAKIANAESLKLYFTIGKLIDDKIKKEKWGAKVLEDISSQLQAELPGLRGFSAMSLKKMRVFYVLWHTVENQYNTIWSSATTKLENDRNTISSLPTSRIEIRKNLHN